MAAEQVDIRYTTVSRTWQREGGSTTNTAGRIKPKGALGAEIKRFDWILSVFPIALFSKSFSLSCFFPLVVVVATHTHNRAAQTLIHGSQAAPSGPPKQGGIPSQPKKQEDQGDIESAQ
jgi:hypothetical protein